MKERIPKNSVSFLWLLGVEQRQGRRCSNGVVRTSPGHIVVQGKGVSCTLNSIQYETMLIKVWKIRKRLEKDWFLQKNYEIRGAKTAQNRRK